MLLVAFLPVMPASAETSTLGISITERMNRGDSYAPTLPTGGSTSNGTLSGDGVVTITNNLASTDLYNISITFNKGSTSNWTSSDGAYVVDNGNGKVTVTIPKLAHGASMHVTYTVESSATLPLYLTATYDNNKVNVGGSTNITVTLNKDTSIINADISNVVVIITPKDLNNNSVKDWVFSNCNPSKGNATVNGRITWNVGTLAQAESNPTLSFRATENDEAAHNTTDNLALFDMADSDIAYQVTTSPTTAGVSIDGNPTAITSGLSTDLSKQQLSGNSWQFAPKVTNTNSENVTFTLSSVSFWATPSNDLNTIIDQRTLTQGSSNLPNDLPKSAAWTATPFSFVYNGVPAGFIKPSFTVKDDDTQMPKAYSSTNGADSVKLLKKIWVLNGYNIEVTKTVTDQGSGVYRIDIAVKNIGSKKSPDTVLVYDIVPAAFNAGNFSPAYTGTTSVTNPVVGTAYWWNVGPIDAGATKHVNYTATGSGNYPLMDIFLVGVDPAQSMSLQSTPLLTNESILASANFESLAALGAAGLLVVGMIGTARRRL
ncbi:hypothetical protein [Methanocella conradii]|uniref:hypothetical protein n=1 Tax=Methanocella conradii TaxID=1175444 RepID=UPI00157D7D11|nr:hypothetical protein [Methanocella conradii]